MPFPVKGGTLELANNHYFVQEGITGVPAARVTGLKTGYTNGAGRCYVTTARLGGRHLGVVLLDSPDPIQQVPRLLAAGYRLVYEPGAVSWHRHRRTWAELRETMARNPYLRVLVANGYYDFATPFGGTEYSFAHLGYENTYKERVELTYYEAGHMMYIRPTELKRLKEDVARFIRASFIAGYRSNAGRNPGAG